MFKKNYATEAKIQLKLTLRVAFYYIASSVFPATPLCGTYIYKGKQFSDSIQICVIS